jgi:hypothetical protein
MRAELASAEGSWLSGQKDRPMSDAPDEILRDRPDRKQMMEVLRLREELEQAEQAAREAWALSPTLPEGNLNGSGYAIVGGSKYGGRVRRKRRRGDSGSAGALVPA